MGKKKKYGKKIKAGPGPDVTVEKPADFPLKDRYKLQWRLGLLLAVLAFLLYTNTLHHGFVLDDGLVIAENHTVQKGLDGIPEILHSNYLHGYYNGTSNLYRPFTLVLFAIEWQFFPGDPASGHLVNCLFYAATVFLCFWLLCSFFKSNVLLSFLVALLFTVHPVHTEVVANIKSSDELMAFFCVVIAFLAMMEYMERKKRRLLIIMSVFYFSALMFKESSVTLVAVFPLILYFFTKAVKKDYLRVMSGILAVTVLQIIIRTWVLQHQMGIGYAFLKIHNSLVAARDINEKTASVMMILGRYLGLLFLPYPLSSDYAFNQVPLVRWDSMAAVVSLIVYAGLIVIVFVRLRKREPWVFGIIFYLITLSLYSNLFVPVGATVAERFLYIPSFGFCITVTCLLTMFFKRGEKQYVAIGFKQSLKQNISLVIAISFLVILCAVQTFTRNKDWKNNLSLYSADIKTSPNSARMNYWYGNEIMIQRAKDESDPILRKNYYDTAVSFLDIAIRIYPEYGEAYSQRGLAYFRLSQFDKAEKDYLQAVNYHVAQWQVYNNLAVIYAQRNDLADALKYFNYSLKLDNKNASVHKNIGNIYHVQKDYLNAIKKYKDALTFIQPGDSLVQKEVYGHLADDYKIIGDTPNAAHFRKLLKRN